MRVLARVLMFALAVPPVMVLAGGEGTHTGVVKTKRFTIHFRPGSRAAADVDRQAVAAERDLDRIAAALDTTPKGPFDLWVYDDVPELNMATGTAGNGGFSFDKASHVPYGNDQTRLHELVHVVTHEWPKSGPETRNLFLVEGISNAVLEFVHGVHVHAVAAHYKKAGRLPAIAEMADAPDFYAWNAAHPGFNSYDVAGSWMRFLLDTHGTAKVKRYYTGTPAKTALGADVATLEKAWWAVLDKHPLRPEVETLLSQRDGAAVHFKPFIEGVPPALLGKPEDWTALLGEEHKPDRPASWRSEGGKLTASNSTEDWIACDLGSKLHGDCVVRVKVSTTGYTPVQVRFGPDNQVMFVHPGTFLYRGERGVASDPAVKLPMGSSTLDVVLVRQGTRVQVWVDGRAALDTAEATDGPLPIGVGINKGSARFEDVRVRPLP